MRSELLTSFTDALLPLSILDRFKLAGVVATWWTEALPDLKTLMENGFAGVIEGWVDAISDAVEDDDNVGSAFDPFSHKLVLRAMADYLQRIDDAKADIARLKGEKEAFEQANPREDGDEDELATWNYARDLESQIKDLKRDNRDALRRLKKLDSAADRRRATDEDREVAVAARSALEPVLGRIEALEGELMPYEQIKAGLTAARACFRALVGSFVSHGFVDLVFYHRILKCHVLVELKVDAFSHEHLGQLNTSVSRYGANEMAEGDNPPVGLLLCTERDHVLVEYALAGLDNRLFVSRYQLELPSTDDLRRFIKEQRREVGG